MNPKILVHINEYGPIKNAEIKFYPLLLITGNSNLGKSYVNYLFYFLMRALAWVMFQSLVEKKYSGMNFAKKQNSFKLTENDMRKWLTENVQPFMASFLGDSELLCDVSFDLGLDNVFPNGILDITYTREIQHQTEDSLPDMLFATISINGDVSTVSLLANDKRGEIQRLGQRIATYFQNKLFGQSILKSVILPPARGSYVGENFSAKEMIASQAGMYRYFLQDYDFGLHSIFNNFKTNDEQFFQARIKTLVNGDLITEDNKQYLVLGDRKLPLTAAASSIKELSPFLFYLKNWSNYKFSFCMEEPEAHLHPCMQKDVADLLAACLNKGMIFQMTSHSDYFMQRINQLVLLGNLRSKDEAAYEVFRQKHGLNQRFYLKAEDVGCYYFHEVDGEVKIECLEMGKTGLPMKTFFGIVRDLSDFDDELAIALNPEEYGNNK